jgi:hypothetical protein
MTALEHETAFNKSAHPPSRQAGRFGLRIQPTDND